VTFKNFKGKIKSTQKWMKEQDKMFAADQVTKITIEFCAQAQG
jgi:hypothetical protein